MDCTGIAVIFWASVWEQMKYSLKSRMIELEVLPAYRNCGLSVIAYSPLASGLLGGAMEGQRAQGSVRKSVEYCRPQLARYESLCRELGQEPANVALAWTLLVPALTGPIIGPATLDQLTDCIRCLDLALDEIWSSPGDGPPRHTLGEGVQSSEE